MYTFCSMNFQGPNCHYKLEIPGIITGYKISIQKYQNELKEHKRGLKRFGYVTTVNHFLLGEWH